MSLKSPTKKSSLGRMKSGLKRFLNTVEEMREYIQGDDEELVEYVYEEVEIDENDPEYDEIEDELPEAIVEDTRREEQRLASEQAQLIQWRTELEQLLKGREERIGYFKQYADESKQRYERMLQTAREQLSGISPELETNEQHDEDLNAPIEHIVEPEPEQVDNPDIELYQRPSLKLLTPADISQTVLMTPEALEAQKNALQEAMDSFAVDAYVYDAVIGPRVTQFRVQPGMGVRVEAISALQKNIALAMANTNIRIQAPIPGEPFVGIEVGNSNSVPVLIRSMLESRAWHESEHDIPLIMGMDIQGKIILTDLAKAPHLLIAGATGSGKSVCMSTLILSLLYKFRPDELELVLIDPKRVEFGLFKDIPHLIHSVVTEPKPAVQILKWCVAEMERRYQVLADKQVRNIAGYNQKAEQEGFKKMPFQVVIIDELADLMMTSKGEAEAALARIAQLSRAVGIHTIIATQRPSVNVITGVIKANYPTRIAFQVSSNVDSRTILDCKGAESLLGAGDFLFNPPGIARLIRIQSPFVQDQEIIDVVTHVAGQRKAEMRVDLSGFESMEGDRDGKQMSIDGIEGDDDEALFKKALLTVAETQKASTSFLQRRLRIGYNRAALLIEELEDRMYIGPQNGSTPREVFISPEEIEWAR
ncbi:cell division protein FtsK/SpoIIIE [Coraliomargarita akajimensis DSM 45221]|uniref:Cell division protein FtsK/SpoIIIE n=2 Tax=Coraliomargarita TaxID=442430 RepID=D5EMW4_CORAD|nr:cell division protein FtsK/SpoIIIE [Coraliomargarita akajimensis DSM 45221]